MNSSTIEQRDLELFNTIADEYGKKDSVPSCRDAREYQLLAGFVPLLRAHTPRTILEIGCGIGASAEYLKGHYTTYHGIDYSDGQIAIAQKLYGTLPNTHFHVLNVKDMHANTLPEVDTLLAVGAFHHFTDLDSVFQSIRQVLQPGGWVVAVEPQRGNPLIQALRFIRTKIDPHYSSEQTYFTAKELHALFASHGFTDITIQHQGFFTPPFAQVPLYPQWIWRPLSHFAIMLDKACDAYLPTFFHRLSWNIVVRAHYKTNN
jgi:SAM-dependent methyltransferase